MNLWVRFLAALDILFIWSLKALLLAVAFGMVLVTAAPAMDRPGIKMIPSAYNDNEMELFRKAERLCQAFSSGKH